jgi:hypothetical protein
MYRVPGLVSIKKSSVERRGMIGSSARTLYELCIVQSCFPNSESTHVST